MSRPNSSEDLPDFDVDSFLDSPEENSSDSSDLLAETQFEDPPEELDVPEEIDLPEELDLPKVVSKTATAPVPQFGEPGEETGRRGGPASTYAEPGEEIGRREGVRANRVGEPGDQITPRKKGKGLLIGTGTVAASAAVAAGLYFSGLIPGFGPNPTNSPSNSAVAGNTNANPGAAGLPGPNSGNTAPVTDPAKQGPASAAATASNSASTATTNPMGTADVKPNQADSSALTNPNVVAGANTSGTNAAVANPAPMVTTNTVASNTLPANTAPAVLPLVSIVAELDKVAEDQKTDALKKLLQQRPRLEAHETKKLHNWVQTRLVNVKDGEKKDLALLQQRLMLQVIDEPLTSAKREPADTNVSLPAKGDTPEPEVPAEEKPTEATTPSEEEKPAAEAKSAEEAPPEAKSTEEKTVEEKAPEEKPAEAGAPEEPKATETATEATEPAPESEKPADEKPAAEKGASLSAPAEGAFVASASPRLVLMASLLLSQVDPQSVPAGIEANSDDQKVWELQSLLAMDATSPPLVRAGAHTVLTSLCRKYEDWANYKLHHEAAKTVLNEIRQNAPELTDSDLEVLNSIRERVGRYELELRVHETEKNLQALQKDAVKAADLDKKANKEDLDGKANQVDLDKKVSSEKLSEILALENAKDLLTNFQLKERIAKEDPPLPEGADPKLVERMAARKTERDSLAKSVEKIEADLAVADRPATDITKDLSDLRNVYDKVLAWELERAIIAGTPGAQVDPKKLEEQIATSIGTKLDLEISEGKLKGPLESLQKLPKDLIGKADIEKLILTPDTGTSAPDAGKVNVGLNAKVGALTRQLEELRKQLDDQTKTLQKKADTALASAETAKTQASAAGAGLDKLSGSVEKLNTAASTLKAEVSTLDSTGKSLTNSAKATEQSLKTSIEKTSESLNNKIEEVRNAPRPLVPEERQQLVGQASTQVLNELHKMGYVAPSFRVPGLPSKPGRADSNAAKVNFLTGRDAFFSSDPANLPRAVQQFSQAVELNPRQVTYRYFLGLALYKTGIFQEGAEQVRTAAELERNGIQADLGALERVQGPMRQWLEFIRRSAMSGQPAPDAKPAEVLEER